MNSRDFDRERPLRSRTNDERRRIVRRPPSVERRPYAAWLFCCALFLPGPVAAQNDDPRAQNSFHSRSVQLRDCDRSVRLSAAPVAPQNIEGLSYPGPRERDTLYFLHGSGRDQAVFAPIGGRVVQLDAITVWSEGREHLYYAVHIAPCRGALVSLSQLDVLSEELQLPLRGLTEQDCRYAGPDRGTTICSVRPGGTGALTLATGETIGASREGLISLRLAYETEDLRERFGGPDLITTYLEPIRSLLAGRLTEPGTISGPAPAIGGCPPGGCSMVQGAWTRRG